MRRVRTSDFTLDENAPSKLILCHCEKCSLWFCLLKKNYMSQESTLFKDFRLNLVNGCFSFRFYLYSKRWNYCDKFWIFPPNFIVLPYFECAIKKCIWPLTKLDNRFFLNYQREFIKIIKLFDLYILEEKKTPLFQYGLDFFEDFSMKVVRKSEKITVYILGQ